MATETRLVDDIDASTDAVATHQFSLDGIDYEIDLCPRNLDTLRTTLTPYTAVGRRTNPTAAKRTKAADGSRSPATLRAWWAHNADRLGLPTPTNHGPIPTAVEAAYRTAR